MVYPTTTLGLVFEDYEAVGCEFIHTPLSTTFISSQEASGL